MDMEQITRGFEAERNRWTVEREALSQAKDTYFSDVRRLNEEVAILKCQVVRLESEHKCEKDLFESEKDRLNGKLEDFRSLVRDKEDELNNIRKETSDKLGENLKELTRLESEILVKDNTILELQNNIGEWQEELARTRAEFDEINAQADETLAILAEEQSKLKIEQARFERNMKERDERIANQEEALNIAHTRINELCNQSFTSEPMAPFTNTKGSAIMEENAELKKKLAEYKGECDIYYQKYNNLKQEIQRRKMFNNTQSENENMVDLKSQRLEQDLNDKVFELEKYRKETEVLRRTISELEKTNSRLIGQFAKNIMPVDDDLDGMQSQFENTQQLIDKNMKLRLRIDELVKQSGTELGLGGIRDLHEQLKYAENELDVTKAEAEKQKVQLENALKEAEYYKTKSEQGGDDFGNFSVAAGEKPSVGRMEAELQIHKRQCEIKALADRLELTLAEKASMEANYQDILHQKNELIAQTTTSKQLLEVQVKNYEESVAKLQAQLEEVDKTNRKLSEQDAKLKSTQDSLKQQINLVTGQLNEIRVEAERLRNEKQHAEMELSYLQREAAELRARSTYQSENQTVTNVVLDALSTFRTAYTDINQDKLNFIEAELAKSQNECNTLRNVIQNINSNQIGSTDALKQALANAELSRERYRSRSIQLEQDFNALKFDYDELKSKFEQLNQQMTGIDASDNDLDSCKKEIQQLKNKKSYLEKHVLDAELKVEALKGQIKESDERCKNFKATAERFEKALSENVTTSQNEREEYNKSLQERDNVIEGLNAKEQELLEHINKITEQFTTEQANRGKELSNLQSYLQTVQNEKSSFELELANLRAQLQQVDSSLNESNNVLMTKENKIQELEQSLQDVNQTLAAQNSVLDESNNESNKVKQQLGEAQTSFKERLHEQDIVIAALKKQLAEAERLRTEGQGLDRSFYDDAIQKINESFHDISNRSLNESHELNDSISSLLGRRSRASVVDSLSAPRTVTLEQHSQIVNNLQQKLEQQQQTLAERLKEISQLELLKDVEMQKNALQIQYDSLVQKCNTLSESLNLAQAQSKEQSKELYSIKTMFNELSGKLETTEREVQQLRKIIQDKHNESQQLLAEFRNKERELIFKNKQEKDKNEPIRQLARKYRQENVRLEKERDAYLSKLEEVNPSEATALAQKFKEDLDKQVSENKGASPIKPKVAVTQPGTSMATPASELILNEPEPEVLSETESQPTRGVKRRVEEPQDDEIEVIDDEEPQQKIAKDE